MPIADRLLAGALTCVLVARSVVGGTDPSRLSLATGTASLDLHLLTLSILLITAAARGFLNRSAVGVGRTGVVLAVALAWLVAAAWMAPYQHPAGFVVWDALTAFVAFYLVRQLAREPAVGDGLIPVLLATAFTSTMLALPGAVGWAVPGAIAQPPTYLFPLLLLTLPVGCVLGGYGLRAGGWNRLIVVAVLAMAVVGGMALVPPFLADADRFGDPWPAMAVMQSNALFGSGPGNFAAVANEPSAHSAWLHLGATCGVPMLAVLLAALGVFAAETRSPREAEMSEPDAGVRWDLYAGGMAGLLLGFALVMTDKPRSTGVQSLLDGGIVAITRALLWFASLALFEGVFVSGRGVTRSLVVGVVLVAAGAAFSDAALLPAVMLPVSAVAALAVNRSKPVPEASAVGAVTRWWLAPTALVLVLAFALLSWFPATNTARAVHVARARVSDFRTEADWVGKVLAKDRRAMAGRAEAMLVSGVITPLTEAWRYDSGNAALLAEWSRWVLVQWELHLAAATGPGAERKLEQAADIAKFVDGANRRAIKFDPQNAERYADAFASMVTLARESKAKRVERLARAEELLTEATRRDGAREARMRYELLAARFHFADAAQQAEASKGAIALLKLDRAAVGERYKLTESQRRQVEAWLGGPEFAAGLLDDD